MKNRALLAVMLLIIIFIATGIRAAKDYITVTVKEGDTLWAIAKEHLKDPSRWPEILKFNNIENPNLIRPGMVLKIPNSLLKKKPASPSPKPKPSPKPVGPPSTEPSPSPTPAASPAPAPAATPSLTPTPSPRKGPKGSAVYVRGEVLRIPDKGNEEPLKSGAKLSAGDRLVTDASSFASFSLPAGGELKVGSDTRLKIDIIEESSGSPGGNLTLQLEQGRVRIQAGKRGLSINLKAGSTTVSATEGEMQFRFEEGITKYLEVYRGKATVTLNGSSVAVNSGNGVIISQTTMTNPKALPPAPILKAYSFVSEEGPKGGVMWEHSDKVASYRLEIAQDEEFLKPIYLVGYAGTSLDFAFFQQFPPGKYAFRLIAVSADGLWSAPSNSMVYNQ